MNFADPSQLENQGGNLYSAEHLLEDDSLLEKLKAIKDKAQEEEETQFNKIKASLVKIRSQKKNDGYGTDFNSMKELQQRRSSRDKKKKAEIQVGDKVRIKTSRFGKARTAPKPSSRSPWF